MEKPLLLLLLATITPPTIFILSAINYYWDYAEHIFSPDASSEIYDFIVVGSGSSGAVVAHRLSKNYKVLLLEAGGDPIFLNSIPGLAFDLLGYEDHDWNYKSVPQTNFALSHYNKQISQNRGKVMGGSSTLNYMFYLRGHPLDYDNWANITGDPEWKYENILPFFKKSIKEYKGQFQENKKQYGSSPYGFLTIEKLNWSSMTDTFIQAGADVGLKMDIDANGPQTSGVGSIEVNQLNGERVSTYSGILRGASTNKNLRISKYSQATMVKLDKFGKAIGVWYYRHGKKHLVKASKEVILSAGAFDSPKLLMLSGIGPKKELEALGINSKIDLPVGKNLQDHYGSLIIPISIKASTTFFFERDFGLGVLYKYLTQGSGILTAPSAAAGHLFFNSSFVTEKDWADIQSVFFNVAPSRTLIESIQRSTSIRKEIVEETIIPGIGKDGFMILTLLVRPKSRGDVTLKDKNPFSHPLIDPRPFSHPDDMWRLIEGINISLKLIEESKSFRNIDTKFMSKPISKCGEHKSRSNAYWECYTRHVAVSIWHPVGTCKMGQKDDPTAVLDSKLRVLKTRGLRVIDASIMPVIVNANTNAPCMMIGEKGADMILEYWASQFLVCDRIEYLRYQDIDRCYYSR